MSASQRIAYPIQVPDPEHHLLNQGSLGDACRVTDTPTRRPVAASSPQDLLEACGPRPSTRAHPPAPSATRAPSPTVQRSAMT